MKTIALILATLIIVPTIWGQSVSPPEADVVKKKRPPQIELDRHSKEFAESYLNLLEQIEIISDDYRRYLSIRSGSTDACIISLQSLSDKIGKGFYLTDLDRLKSDISSLKSEIKKMNLNFSKEKLATHEYEKAKKQYKLYSSLDHQLERVNDLIEIDMETQLEALVLAELTMEPMLNYVILRVQETMIQEEEKEARAHAYSFTYHTDHNGNVSVGVVSTTPQAESTYSVWVVPEAPEAPDAPDNPGFPDLQNIPSIPDVPYFPEVVIYSGDIISRTPKGHTLLKRINADSSHQLEPNTPVSVFNPTGDLTISTWSENYVKVESIISISSEKKYYVEELSDKINTHIFSRGNKLFVKVEIPTISDTKTQILDHSLIVYIPRTSPLSCQSSFGDVNISDISGDLKINGNQSTINLNRISGEIVVVGHGAPITIDHSAGLINVKNSLGAIILSGCEGEFELQNRYSITKVEQCEGMILVRGEGEIQIYGHEGNATIFNRNGRVKVAGLEGTLIIENSHGPIDVSTVEGSIEVSNIFATIDINDIFGSLKATNKQAPISVSGLTGPTTLVTDNGDIDVVVTSELSGNSTITTIDGRISVTILEEPDLLVTTDSKSGSLKTTYPLKLEQVGDKSVGKYKFGNGKYSLALSSERGMIEIKPQR